MIFANKTITTTKKPIVENNQIAIVKGQLKGNTAEFVEFKNNNKVKIKLNGKTKQISINSVKHHINTQIVDNGCPIKQASRAWGIQQAKITKWLKGQRVELTQKQFAQIKPHAIRPVNCYYKRLHNEYTKSNHQEWRKFWQIKNGASNIKVVNSVGEEVHRNGSAGMRTAMAEMEGYMEKRVECGLDVGMFRWRYTWEELAYLLGKSVERLKSHLYIYIKKAVRCEGYVEVPYVIQSSAKNILDRNNAEFHRPALAGKILEYLYINGMDCSKQEMARRLEDYHNNVSNVFADLFKQGYVEKNGSIYEIQMLEKIARVENDKKAKVYFDKYYEISQGVVEERKRMYRLKVAEELGYYAFKNVVYELTEKGKELAREIAQLGNQ